MTNEPTPLPTVTTDAAATDATSRPAPPKSISAASSGTHSGRLSASGTNFGLPGGFFSSDGAVVSPKASTCAPVRSPAAASAGATGWRTTAPRCSAWSRRNR